MAARLGPQSLLLQVLNSTPVSTPTVAQMHPRIDVNDNPGTRVWQQDLHYHSEHDAPGRLVVLRGKGVVVDNITRLYTTAEYRITWLAWCAIPHKVRNVADPSVLQVTRGSLTYQKGPARLGLLLQPCR